MSEELQDLVYQLAHDVGDWTADNARKYVDEKTGETMIELPLPKTPHVQYPIRNVMTKRAFDETVAGLVEEERKRHRNMLAKAVDKYTSERAVNESAYNEYHELLRRKYSGDESVALTKADTKRMKALWEAKAMHRHARDYDASESDSDEWDSDDEEEDEEDEEEEDEEEDEE